MSLFLSILVAASVPLILFPRNVPCEITLEQIVAAFLFWPILILSIALIFFSLFKSPSHNPAYFIVLLLSSSFPLTLGGGIAIQKISTKIEATERAKREKWFTYGKRINPLLIEHILSHPDRVQFPFNDDRAEVNGIGNLIRSKLPDIPTRGDDIIDPWGETVLIVMDHDSDMQLKFPGAFYGVWNRNGNKIVVSLYARHPHSLRTDCNEQWQIEGGRVPNQP